MSLDTNTRRRFVDQKKLYGGSFSGDSSYSGGGAYGRGGDFGGGAENMFFHEKPSDLRSVLARKQITNITDLRAKIKPKALYTNKLASKIQPPDPPVASMNGSDVQERKKLRLTTTFKNSVSSAMAGSTSSEGHKSSRIHSRKSELGLPNHHRLSSNRLPSHDEAKKISVTVPGLSRPISEYSSHRREERLANQIARSREMRQDGFMRGREEFLASAITSAISGAGSLSSVGGSNGGGGAGMRERRNVGPSITSRVQRGRAPSPLEEYHSYEPLYTSGDIHGKVPPPTAPSYSSGGGSSRQRGLTTATSMFISNLSDTVSKNDVAELCSVVGALDCVYIHAPGIAEVIFKYKDDALEAYKKYNQRNLDGQPMHCKLQPASRARMSVGGGGYGHSYADDYFTHSGSGFY